MRIGLILALALSVIGFQAQAAERGQQTVDNQHVKRWNEFSDKLLAMHKELLATRDLKETTRIGGYRGNPNFYKEHAYHDAKTGKLLTRIHWELQNPDQMHVLEVFLYDKQGRLSRDYTVAFLPGFRNAPSQTLVTLYNYNGKLKAFRNFDANDEITYESCEGDWKGKHIDFSFEDYEIIDLQQKGGIGDSPEYKACFEPIPYTAKAFLPPKL